jgi:hypothetical protein
MVCVFRQKVLAFRSNGLRHVSHRNEGRLKLRVIVQLLPDPK